MCLNWYYFDYKRVGELAAFCEAFKSRDTEKLACTCLLPERLHLVRYGISKNITPRIHNNPME